MTNIDELIKRANIKSGDYIIENRDQLSDYVFSTMGNYRKYNPMDESDNVFYIDSIVDDNTVRIKWIVEQGKRVNYYEECGIDEALLISVENAEVRTR